MQSCRINKYACPVHPEVILFTEQNGVHRMMIPERPVECAKCKKSYYKEECKIRRIGK